MVTKAQIADLIRDNKSGGIPSADNTKFAERNIFKMVDIAYSSLLELAYKEGEKNFGSYVTTHTNIAVKFDEDRDEKFSDLPAKLLSLPNDEGLREVRATQDVKSPFILTNNGNVGIYTGLHAEKGGGIPVCYLEGDKIFYQGLSDNIKKVLIKLVGSIENLNKNKAIPIPADKELQLYDIVVERMTEQKVTKEDNYNNANSNLIGR